MTAEEAIAKIRVWTNGMTFDEISDGYSTACVVLADEVERLRCENKRLNEELGTQPTALYYSRTRLQDVIVATLTLLEQEGSGAINDAMNCLSDGIKSPFTVSCNAALREEVERLRQLIKE